MIAFPVFSGERFRLGDNLDVIACLNGSSFPAPDIKERIGWHNDAKNAIKKELFVFFAPDLQLEYMEHWQHWSNQLAHYDSQLRREGFVTCNIDPKLPPPYKRHEDKTYVATVNGRSDSNYQIYLPKQVEIAKYIISYGLVIAELSEIPTDYPIREVSYDPDNCAIKIPIDLIENNFGKTDDYYHYYYPDTKPETKIYQGTLCRNDDIKKENNFKSISMRELVEKGKNTKDEYLFLTLSRICFFPDKFFDRFPDKIFFKIKLGISPEDNLTQKKEITRKAGIYAYVAKNKLSFCALVGVCSLLVWLYYSKS